ncbi:MAG TPA: molybdopterin-dependent oxidoreductase [Kofleriaceae bacterium]|nr:molybdopterin-dependent oxidoreductase [Kofleriaceae bacterium]
MARDTRMQPSTPCKRVVPAERLVERVTFTEDVYVIAHLGIAQVDASDWRLHIDGMVERPFALDHAALTSLPAVELTSVLACFGNPLEPDIPTRQAANVVWRGARVADLLERAGLRDGARLVWAEGLDHGSFFGAEADCYVKDIPLSRACEPDVLVAWDMNGRPLTAEHGYPARLVVPGYFGTHSVKWLTRLTVSDVRPDHLFTTRLYNRQVIVDDQIVIEPARELDVQSILVTPSDGARLARGLHPIAGWAFSAYDIEAVDVSVDAGATWQPAQLGAPPATGHEWQPFTHSFGPLPPGPYEICARATDARGRIQPDDGRNAIHRVRVMVE